MSKVTLTIDGMHLSAEEGMTVLEAAQANGLYIPNLCNHPDLKPAGLCRVCVVKMDDWKVVISCKQPVKDGMVISTEDPEVQQIRKNTVELLVANHPMTCLTCEADGNCELQRVAHYVGVNPEGLNRYRRSVRSIPIDKSNPFFDFDHNKCILCGICVRTCDELQNINAIDYAKRGVNSVISTLGNKPIAESRCESCGECVVRCPVAALSPKGARNRCGRSSRSALSAASAAASCSASGAGRWSLSAATGTTRSTRGLSASRDGSATNSSTTRSASPPR